MPVGKEHCANSQFSQYFREEGKKQNGWEKNEQCERGDSAHAELGPFPEAPGKDHWCPAAQVLVPCYPAPCATTARMTLPQPRPTLFALGISPFPPLQLPSAGNPSSPVLLSSNAATPKLGSFGA